MRIIAGNMKGRKLLTPADDSVRPTSDKVKGAVFNMIGGADDAVVLDLFAGTGNLGLEALSRGAGKCYFCDNSGASIELIRENIKKLGAEDHSVIIKSDWRRGIAQIREEIDIVFLDPPYGRGILEEVLSSETFLRLIAPGGLIIAEHEGRLVPDFAEGYELLKTKSYGKTVIDIFEKEPEENEEEL